MKGKIHIEGMEFYAYHGCYKEERIVGSKFLIDLVIESDISKAAHTDSLSDTVNYQKVYEVIKEEMTKKSYLLEHIAGRIIKRIYATFAGIEYLTVKVSKLNPAMGGKINAVCVTLSQ